MKDTIKIGLVGFGTVGKGVYNVISENSEIIKERTGLKAEISMICDLRVEEVSKAVSSSVTVTADWKEIIGNPEVDTIVELIGGIEPAKTIILEALKAGKHVVTANKKLLAEAGEEIFRLVTNSSTKLGFEAAVGGGIPCIDALKDGLVANQVQSVMGILNGTTNYILTQMEEEGLSFEEALAEAQAEGFAEVDPTFDIEGNDAGHKITLLAMLAFNQNVDYHNIDIEGITRIKTMDIDFARSMGYAVKLLGIANRVGDELDVRVLPTMISENHQLASVNREFNAVVFDSDMTGEVLLYGKGAGSNPTASAVVSDIVQIARREGVTESAITTQGNAKILPPSKREGRFYLRMFTEDHSGILEKVAHSFASNDVSIASLMQIEGDDDSVPLLFVTHQAVEENILKAIKEINDYDFIKEPVVMMCIVE